MNDIALDKQSSLHVGTVSDLTYVTLNGPVLRNLIPCLMFALVLNKIIEPQHRGCQDVMLLTSKILITNTTTNAVANQFLNKFQILGPLN